MKETREAVHQFLSRDAASCYFSYGGYCKDDQVGMLNELTEFVATIATPNDKARVAAEPELRALGLVIQRAREFRHGVDETGRFISDLEATTHLCKAIDALEAIERGQP